MFGAVGGRVGVLFMMLRQSAINVNVNIHISGHAEIMDCINARKMRSLAENVREIIQLDLVPGIALVTVNGQEYRNLLDFVNSKLVKYMLKYSFLITSLNFVIECDDHSDCDQVATDWRCCIGKPKRCCF